MSLFGRKDQRTPEQDAAAARVLRAVLGPRFAATEDSYFGSRDGRMIVEVPRDLRRIYFQFAMPDGLKALRDVRFRDDGTVRRSKEVAAGLSPAAQEAIGTLGRLGCTEVSFQYDGLMVQMPYGQTPEQFVEQIAAFADAGDALVDGLVDRATVQPVRLQPWQEARHPWELANSPEPPSGSVGPPS